MIPVLSSQARPSDFQAATFLGTTALHRTESAQDPQVCSRASNRGSDFLGTIALEPFQKSQPPAKSDLRVNVLQTFSNLDKHLSSIPLNGAEAGLL